jgi:hypothetical protein
MIRVENRGSSSSHIGPSYVLPDAASQRHSPLPKLPNTLPPTGFGGGICVWPAFDGLGALIQTMHMGWTPGPRRVQGKSRREKTKKQSRTWPERGREIHLRDLLII